MSVTCMVDGLNYDLDVTSGDYGRLLRWLAQTHGDDREDGWDDLAYLQLMNIDLDSEEVMDELGALLALRDLPEEFRELVAAAQTRDSDSSWVADRCQIREPIHLSRRGRPRDGLSPTRMLRAGGRSFGCWRRDANKKAATLNQRCRPIT